MSPCFRIAHPGPGFLCGGSPRYEFGGFLFEWHRYCGPALLDRRTGDPRKTIPRGFWNAVERFQKLPPEQRESYRAEVPDAGTRR